MNEPTRITRYGGTTIYSIFGQIEEVAAEFMLKKGKGRKIPLTDFPDERTCPEVWTNVNGERAKFAIQLDKHEKVEFDRVIETLRA